jgi:hypothetical protein
MPAAKTSRAGDVISSTRLAEGLSRHHIESEHFERGDVNLLGEAKLARRLAPSFHGLFSAVLLCRLGQFECASDVYFRFGVNSLMLNTDYPMQCLESLRFPCSSKKRSEFGSRMTGRFLRILRSRDYFEGQAFPVDSAPRHRMARPDLLLTLDVVRTHL